VITGTDESVEMINV